MKHHTMYGNNREATMQHLRKLATDTDANSTHELSVLRCRLVAERAHLRSMLRSSRHKLVTMRGTYNEGTASWRLWEAFEAIEAANRDEITEAIHEIRALIRAQGRTQTKPVDLGF